jgi:hypothetical protein
MCIYVHMFNFGLLNYPTILIYNSYILTYIFYFNFYQQGFNNKNSENCNIGVSSDIVDV